MKLSKLITELQIILDTHGDLNVQAITRDWEESSLPSDAMGGGGAGWSDNSHGTVKAVKVSEKYPDQVEIVFTR